MIIERHVYCFKYKVLKLPKYRDDHNDWYWIDINVLEDDFNKARNKAEKWLEGDGHKFWKYTEWVGFQPDGSTTVLDEIE